MYEKVAGALNSWEKTHGMRLGSLRGSTHLPPGAHVSFMISTILPRQTRMKPAGGPPGTYHLPTYLPTYPNKV